MDSEREEKLRRYLTVSADLVREEQWDDLRELMAQAVEAFPDDPELCLRYAISLSEVSPDEAISYARRAADHSWESPSRLTRCASYLYGLGEIEDAGRYIRAVLPLIDEGFPLIADVFHLIGILAVAKNNSTVADKYLRLAFDVEPAGRDHAYRLAHFLATCGMPGDALDVIAKGLEHGSPDEEKLLELRDLISEVSGF
jgi:uncharacterized protein HemY